MQLFVFAIVLFIVVLVLSIILATRKPCTESGFPLKDFSSDRSFEQAIRNFPKGTKAAFAKGVVMSLTGSDAEECKRQCNDEYELPDDRVLCERGCVSGQTAINLYGQALMRHNGYT